jgi:hypothetical protein
MCNICEIYVEIWKNIREIYKICEICAKKNDN